MLDGLIERGYEINLLVGKGSFYKTSKTFFYKNQNINVLSRAFRRIDFSVKSFLLSHDCDIIHTFKNWPSYHFLVNKLNKPIIYSQQFNCGKDDLRLLEKHNPNNGFIWGVSKNALSKLEYRNEKKVFFIPMAIDTELIKPILFPKRNYLAYLGRLNYEKGIDLAVKISKLTGIKLKIAGVVRESEKDSDILFEEKVKPFLGEDIEFIGPIEDSQKSDFLGNAKALLVPNRWEEPFGLVMAESLAAGTPVIGSNRGSIPEIIKSGYNGFVCNSLEEMCIAVSRLGELNYDNCRKSALKNYSKDIFIDSVLEMYHKALDYSMSKI